jgi:protein phosphatase
MPLCLQAAGRTDVGLHRTENEDSYLIDPTIGLCVLADGMGGHASGRLASTIAVNAIAEMLRNPSMLPTDGVDPLVRAIQEANTRIWTESQASPQHRGMGTTVVAIRAEGDLIHLAHVGDSRIYRLRGDELVQVTRDHSLINLYADDPALAAQFGPPHSNIIVRAVGLREAVDVDCRPVSMEPGDEYVLCCDGLTDMVDDWIIREVLVGGRGLDPAETCEALVRAALANGGHDNVTVILLRIVEA